MCVQNFPERTVPLESGAQGTHGNPHKIVRIIRHSSNALTSFSDE